VGVGPSKFISWFPEWPSCGIYINILCKYITEGSVYLQHNVMLYIQKSVSENAGNCSHRSRKIQTFSGGEYPQPPPPPTIKCDTTPNFLLPTNHLSFLHTRYSMVPFCRSPPPTDEFLKNALQWSQAWVTVRGWVGGHPHWSHSIADCHE
jgi:hypothetical protein